MTQQIIILNGPAGVGKTTTARALAAQSPNSAHISGDAINDFIVNRTPTVKGRLGYKNGADSIINFINAGYDLVVFEYVFPSPDQINYTKQLLAPISRTTPTLFITLWADLAAVKKREDGRQGRKPLGPKLEDCYKELAHHLREFDNVLDTTHLTTPQVVDQINQLTISQWTTPTAPSSIA